MTDFISLTIVRGRDGGLSVHETSQNNDQALVFAGDTKQVTEYFGQRATALASGKKQESDGMEIPVRRAALSPSRLADRLVVLDHDEHVA
jgi:hypothetical protein